LQPLYQKGYAANSSTDQFKLGSVYITDKAGKVTKASSLPNTVYNASSCTTSNVLKSLFYRVFYQEDGNLGYYKIRAIAVDVLLQD
jgi:hypothetical protein